METPHKGEEGLRGGASLVIRVTTVEKLLRLRERVGKPGEVQYYVTMQIYADLCSTSWVHVDTQLIPTLPGSSQSVLIPAMFRIWRVSACAPFVLDVQNVTGIVMVLGLIQGALQVTRRPPGLLLSSESHRPRLKQSPSVAQALQHTQNIRHHQSWRPSNQGFQMIVVYAETMSYVVIIIIP